MSSKRRTILIVDDLAVNRELLKVIFEDLYDVIEAGNGREALDVLEAGEDISAILLDIRMPVMDGITFLKEIRDIKKFSSIPVLVNTTVEQANSELEALKLGADDFITKPYNAEIVRRRVQNIIGKYVLERERLKRQLKDTKRQLESIVDTVPGGIVILAVGELIEARYFNTGMRRILGFSEGEPIRELHEDVSEFISPGTRAEVVDMFRENVSRHDPVHCSFPIETIQGEEVWLDLHGAFFKEEKGVPLYHCVLTDITEAVALREELEYRVARDLATGVYNAETFYDIAHQFIRVSQPGEYEITYWNIERFKGINDLFGIDMGNRVIRIMASNLQTQFRTYGFVGRINADNFAVLCRKDKYNYRKILEGLHKELKKTRIYYDIIVTCGVYEVTDITLPPAIMCDRAKLAAQGNLDYMRNPISYFKEPLRETYLLEQELIGEMEKALKNKEFFVLLQPIFDTISKKPVSAEALIRWKSKDKGTISPVVFIPLFEKNGFVTNLDYYVLEEVCKMLSDMIAKKETVVPVSVNMSRKDFYDDDVVERVQAVLDKYGIENWMIKIEITESAYTENSEQLISSIRKLRKNGFEVLMDDFGSAYSSLNMLKEVDIDILKIDMKFVDQLEQSQRGANIIVSVNSMAKMLDMIVVAEGVETQYQYEFMRGIGCDRIQGYYFSKPLSIEEFRKLIQEKAGENIIVPAGRSRQQSILVVDDSSLIRASLRKILESNYNVVEAKNGKEAIEYIINGEKRIDLMITDIVMPVMDGMQLLSRLKRDMEWFKVPVLVSSDITDMESVEKALALGAVDYLPKPVNASILTHKVHNIMQISDLENLNNELSLFHTMREKDLTTFTFNRSAFQKKVNEISKYLRELEEIAVFFFIDLDYFREVNDTLGEEAGNQVLKHFSTEIKRRFGEDAVVGRIGGDEFGVYLRPPVTEARLRSWVEEICVDLAVPIEEKGEEKQSCTIGVAVAPYDGENFVDLCRAAGKAAIEQRKRKGPGTLVWCQDAL